MATSNFRVKSLSKRHWQFAAVRISVTFILLTAILPAAAQTGRTDNLFIVTMDGLRWKEVFNGAERKLLTDKRYVSTDSITLDSMFWASTPMERRKKLMPFFWDTFAKHGQLYGNRESGNTMNVKNRYRFSYPG